MTKTKLIMFILASLALFLIGHITGYERGREHQKSYDNIVKTCTMSPGMTNVIVDTIEHSSLPYEVQVEALLQLENNTSCVSSYAMTKAVKKGAN